MYAIGTLEHFWKTRSILVVRVTRQGGETITFRLCPDSTRPRPPEGDSTGYVDKIFVVLLAVHPDIRHSTLTGYTGPTLLLSLAIHTWPTVCLGLFWDVRKFEPTTLP